METKCSYSLMEMLEFKSTVSEMKNDSDGLIGRLDIAKKKNQ